MTNLIYIDRLISIHLACHTINTECSLIAEQICLLTDGFEKKIKNYTQKQLLFLKDCLSLHKHVGQEGINSLLQYQLFLVEQRLKKI